MNKLSALMRPDWRKFFSDAYDINSLEHKFHGRDCIYLYVFHIEIYFFLKFTSFRNFRGWIKRDKDDLTGYTSENYKTWLKATETKEGLLGMLDKKLKVLWVKVTKCLQIHTKSASPYDRQTLIFKIWKIWSVFLSFKRLN